MPSTVKKIKRLFRSPAKNVTVVNPLNMYYISSDNTIYKFARRRSGNAVGIVNNPTNRVLCDMTSDTRHNLFVATKGCIDVMNMTETRSKRCFGKTNCDMKYITTDIHGNVYVLANTGNGHQAHKVRENKLQKLAIHADVHTPFAVDSCRRIYYGCYCLDAQLSCTIGRLEDETINCVCVDREDNVYFGTDTGLFFVKAGTFKAAQIMEVNVPKIMRIAIAHNGSVYIASMDEQRGGVYRIKDS